MKSNNGKISITIDNIKYQVPSGITILKAAQMNGIYIPTLCAHKDLTPYGGCRMCLVEVEGARRFLTACTTPVEPGMIIRTHTDQIQKERREIMELVLSEHTSSCLICDESESCKKAMPTIRKSGVITGCRYCPNDDQCELERVVSYLGIKEIPYPVFYRGLRVEKEDPFYDRDYNLCIYCGRCVRVCQEVRLANVLAFNQRGRNTVIGPAFGRTHVEAGCEFCGSCVSICPTGALAEKYNKWDGVPEFTAQTTCAFCGVGCQLKVKVKNDRVIGTAPFEKGIVNEGELCVKGRFCVPEMVNYYDRLTAATILENGVRLKVSNAEAAKRAAQILKDCPPDQFAMIVSPNLSTEDLYAAQKFTRMVMRSAKIDCSARWFYGKNFNAYLNLFRRATTVEALKKADVILSVGLDLQYGRSVIGYFIRHALRRGAKVITIYPHDHSLALTAEIWIQNHPGEELAVLKQILKELKGEKASTADNLPAQAANLLKKAGNVVVLTGSSFIQHASGDSILETIFKISEEINAGILPLPAQNNLLGSILAGAYAELLPGAISSKDAKHRQLIAQRWKADLSKLQTNWNCLDLIAGKKLKVLYLVGETLPIDENIAEHIIYQNIYPLDTVEPVISLPAAAFTESEGSFVNGEGRVQRTRRIVSPPGDSMPDWKIFSQIAKAMGVSGLEFRKIGDIQKEIGEIIPEYVAALKSKKRLISLPEKITLSSKQPKRQIETQKSGEFIVSETSNENVYRGIPLSEKVAGLRSLIFENAIIINPRDAEKLGLRENQRVKLRQNGSTRIFPVHFSEKQKEQTAQIINHKNQFEFLDPYAVKLEKADV